MKKTVFLSYLALLLCFALPLSRRDGPTAALPPPSAAEEAAALPTPALSAAPAAAPSPAAPAPETLRVLTAEGLREMAMQDYLPGVVAAEMPAAFPEEALKAQAVAARTYALYCAASGKHSGADVCTDPGCCQAWADEPTLRERWGDEYDAWAEKCRAAVAATEGVYLSYEGAPVFAAFHAASAGATEDSGRVWEARPYLRSVPSPESADTVPNFVTTLRCSALDLRDTLLSARPEADLTGAPESWLGELTRDESGRVDTLTLGGVPFRGTELRRLFSLRSAAFTLDWTGDGFLFTVTGSGHGVGMSQYGAAVMAEEGALYPEILAHYYPGTTLERA